MSSAGAAPANRAGAGLLTGLGAVVLTLASIPFPFGPLVVALVLLLVRAAVRRSGGPLAEPVARALGIVAILAALCGIALGVSYGFGGEAEPKKPATRIEHSR